MDCIPCNMLLIFCANRKTKTYTKTKTKDVNYMGRTLLIKF